MAKVVKNLKTLRFNTANIVAREEEKVITLKTSLDCNRGPNTNFDIIEDCQITCKIKVKDRRGPFKVYINYNRNEEKPSENLVKKFKDKPKPKSNLTNLTNNPDLKIYVSDLKAPNEANSS